MNYKGGFTLIELSFSLIVIGIISASIVIRLNSFSKYHNLEKSAWTLFKDYSSLRSKAMKNDCTVRVNFLSTSKFLIHTDLNNNGIKDEIEKSDTVNLPSSIIFGLPSLQPPATAPAGATLPSNGTYTSGNWKTKGIIIDSTSAAVVNTGSLYLNSSSLKKYTFCIAVNDCTQVFKMYKWDGKTWIDQQ